MIRRPHPNQTTGPHPDWIDAPSDDLPERDIRNDVESVVGGDRSIAVSSVEVTSLKPLSPPQQVEPIAADHGPAPPSKRPRGHDARRTVPPAADPPPTLPRCSKRTALHPADSELLPAMELHPVASHLNHAFVRRRQVKSPPALPRGKRWRLRRLPEVVARHKSSRPAPPKPTPPRVSQNTIKRSGRGLRAGKPSKWRRMR